MDPPLKPWAKFSYLNQAKTVYSGLAEERCVSLAVKESCEFLVDTGSDTLLVCVGESWTWGEGTRSGRQESGGVRHIASGLAGLSDPVIRLEDTWSGKLARMSQADLHTHAVPGNSNARIVEAFNRILKETPRGKYKSVKFVICLTDPARDFNGDFEPGDPRYELFVDLGQRDDVGEKVSMDDWIRLYDEKYFEVIENICKENQDLNLDGCIWKNFHNFATTRRDYSFKVIELPYIRWAVKMHGLDDIELPKIQAAAWWGNHAVRIKKLKEVPSIDYINKQLDKIETQYRFIIAVPTPLSELNRTHPNEIGHWAWATYLAEQMSWIDI